MFEIQKQKQSVFKASTSIQTVSQKYYLTDKTICLYNAVKERVLRMNRDILKQIIVDQKEID